MSDWKEKIIAIIGVLADGGEPGIARAIAYAIEQPPEVDVGEIVIRPTA